jgi:hypothetical protein
MSEQSDLSHVYDQFCRIFADSKLLRAPAELAAAIHAEGLEYSQVTPQWLKRLNRSWVYNESDTPFESEDLNRAYWRQLT